MCYVADNPKRGSGDLGVRVHGGSSLRWWPVRAYALVDRIGERVRIVMGACAIRMRVVDSGYESQNVESP